MFLGSKKDGRRFRLVLGFREGLELGTSACSMQVNGSERQHLESLIVEQAVLLIYGQNQPTNLLEDQQLTSRAREAYASQSQGG